MLLNEVCGEIRALSAHMKAHNFQTVGGHNSLVGKPSQGGPADTSLLLTKLEFQYGYAPLPFVLGRLLASVTKMKAFVDDAMDKNALYMTDHSPWASPEL